ncbi:MAG: potassium-transporting ATPase subunit KdpC [bacterium]
MKEIKTAFLLFVTLAFVTGVVYPTAVTVLAQAIFPEQAAGSLIHSAEDALIGSSLIGQHFSDPKYFWPRPSASGDFPYNALASGGSNLGPTNEVLIEQIAERVRSLRKSGIHGSLPTDLVMASGSGLDPHISPAAALIQIPRIVKARNISETELQRLVREHIKARQFGFLGAERVNVLELNLALDKIRILKP